jgi:hypothetical protein
MSSAPGENTEQRRGNGRVGERPLASSQDTASIGHQKQRMNQSKEHASISPE